MAKQSEISVEKFESVVIKLFQAEHPTMKEPDGAKIQFDDFLKSVVRQIFQVLRFFDLRLDQLLSQHLHRNNKYRNFGKVYISTVSRAKCRGGRLQYQ